MIDSGGVTRSRLFTAIFSLIQIATTPRLMVRAPKRLAVTRLGQDFVRHLVLLICKIEMRTDRVRDQRNKRARNGRLVRRETGKAEFSLSLHPDKTCLIEFGRFAADQRARRGLGKPETFKFLGFTFICGRSRQGALRASAKDPWRPHAGEAQGNQEGNATADAPDNPRTGELAEAGRDRLLRVPCGADKQSRTQRVPLPRHGPVARLAQAT